VGRREDEIERLAALASYAILDTAPEPAYDGLARLAAHLCQAPIALITLVDDRRQWFKARIGLDVVSTSRTDSFCAWTLDHDGVMSVDDTVLDPRFADNALVTGEPHIRFYAGAPLRSPDGFTLGALCVIDRRPRDGLTAAQADGLEVLAHQVVTELELRRALVAAREAEDLLIAADHLKDDVVAMTGHELQTPITAIIGASDVLERDWDRLSPSDRDGLVQIVGRQVRRLSSLVQGLLTLASAEARCASSTARCRSHRSSPTSSEVTPR
jgi:GAF domain-containing protein